jgi:hypothetical protein
MGREEEVYVQMMVIATNTTIMTITITIGRNQLNS